MSRNTGQSGAITRCSGVAAISTFFILMHLSRTYGGVLEVPTLYPDIVTAMNAAGKCDTILIDSGSYSGSGFRNLPINDTICITIQSKYGAESTTIDLQNGIFLDGTIASSPNNQIVIVGLTFTRGSPAIQYGYLDHHEIRACTFLNCATGINTGLYSTGPVGIVSCNFITCTVGIDAPNETHLKVSSCVFSGNQVGLRCQFNPYMDVRNCTFVENMEGVLVYTSCCLHLKYGVFFKNTVGFDSYQSGAWDFSCNDVFGNYWNYAGLPDQNGFNGNISVDPKYCDTTLNQYTLASISPLLPGNNSCGQLIGHSSRISCYCGDVDVSGNVDISDIAALISYLYLSGPPPVPIEAGEIDNSSGIDISDLTLLIGSLYIDLLPVPCSK